MTSLINRPSVFFCTVIMSVLCNLPVLRGQDKDARLNPKGFPIPQKATGLVIDQDKQEIRFDIDTDTKSAAKFYKRLLKEKGWKLGFDQVASIFVNLHFSNDGMSIKVNAKKKDIFKKTLSMTIIGDGIAWNGERKVKGKRGIPGPIPAAAENFFKESSKSTRLPDQFKAFDFPLGNSGNTSRDGGLELLKFETKEEVEKVIARYEALLLPKGWKKTKSQKKGEVLQLRFEKNDLYLRFGLWPFTFTNNAGTFNGSKGAIEGTGLSWSDSEPSGNVPERQLASAEKFLGRLSAAKKQQLIQHIRATREAAFWPDARTEKIVQEPPTKKPAAIESVTRTEVLTGVPKETEAKKPARIADVDSLNATITMNGKVHQLKHVIAFDGWWFDEKVPTVIISEKPLDFSKVKAAVNRDFDAQELALLKQRIGRYLKIVATDEKNPSLSGWADNLSFSTSGKDGSRVQVSETRVSGKVGLAKPKKLGPWTYQFKAEFNVPISPTK